MSNVYIYMGMYVDVCTCMYTIAYMCVCMFACTGMYVLARLLAH